MLGSQSLNKDFHKIICENTEILSWITSDAILGIYYSNLDKPEEFSVSQSFWSILNYKDLNPKFDSNLWWNIAGLAGKSTINTMIAAILNDKYPSQKQLFSFIAKDGGIIASEADYFIHEDQYGVKHLILKFIRITHTDVANELLMKKLKKLRRFNEVYEETNALAGVGGWEVDLIQNTITWTRVTKDIHEVPADYEPHIEEGINFYKEGWSRDKIIKQFTDCVENGISFDDEFLIVTQTGKEKWVRSMGKSEMYEGTCIRVYGAFQDIDERKKQEELFKTTELRFQKVFENSSFGIILVNEDNELEMVNPVARKIFGLDHLIETELLEYTFKDVINAEYLPAAIEYRNKLLKGEIDKYDLEVECTHFTGKRIWCSLHCSLIPGGNGDSDLIITQVIDITEKKRLERKSQENATRFKRVFEFSPNGMALVDLKGKWRNVNNNLAQMLGYSKEELIRLSFSKIMHPEDLEKGITEFSRLVKNEIETYQVEKRFIHKNGSLVYCYMTVSALKNDKGHVSSLIGHIVDMTDEINAKKALEESLLDLQAVLDSTTQVIIVETDLNHVIRKFNKGAENLLGYRAEEVVGKQKPGIFHKKEEIKSYAALLEKKYGEKVDLHDVFTYKIRSGDLEAGEWTYKRKDGSEFQVQLLVTEIKNEEGEVKGYLGVSTDISQLKAMETSLLKAKTRAEAANKSKSEFLANMSHEIRTPLNGVIGFTDILMKTTLDENQQKYMETVYTSAVTLLDLINDILDFSKIEAGKLELSEERVNLSDLCGKSIEMIKQQAHQKDIEVLLNVPSELNQYIMADGLRLRQILINLLSNAVKFTQKGEIELKVEPSGKILEAHKMSYRFSIRDTGIGIAPQNLKKIFQAFNQEDASTTRKYGGTGLGLTISNRLLELMNSNLEVESELGLGTTFSFTVDFANDLDSVRDTTREHKIQKILIVDDNENNRIIINEMLLDRNFQTTLVANGIDALELLENNTGFDLAIIDYHMPYLSGLDLVAHIRNELNLTKEVLPVLLLHSSGDDQQINAQSEALGIFNKMVKPVQRNQLFEILNTLETPYKEEKTEKVIVEELDLTSITPTVMIAEDNPVNKFLTRTIVNKLIPNAKLIEVDDGRQAVDAFADHENIDFILMDIQMPFLSGFEATEEIRILEKEMGKNPIPIVALTARAIKGERENCLEQGMDDYVSKPIIYEDLKQCILKFLVPSDQAMEENSKEI